MKLYDLRILVADDHERMRDCIVGVLRMEFDVIGAVCDGNELVTAAITLKPDVIVSDICMPRLSGVEAKRRLQEHGVGIPFVFVTADPYLMQHVTGALEVCVQKIDLSWDLNAKVRSAAKAYATRAVGKGILCCRISRYGGSC
jgi:CheY-like chemotaxis protein